MGIISSDLLFRKPHFECTGAFFGQNGTILQAKTEAIIFVPVSCRIAQASAWNDPVDPTKQPCPDLSGGGGREKERAIFAVVPAAASAYLGTAGEAGAFIHGENACSDVAIDDSMVAQMAAFTVYIAVYMTVDVHFTGLDVALYVGHFSDGNFAGFRMDFAVNFTIDMHVTLEADGADDFDTSGEDVSLRSVHIKRCVGLVVKWS